MHDFLLVSSHKLFLGLRNGILEVFHFLPAVQDASGIVPIVAYEREMISIYEDSVLSVIVSLVAHNEGFLTFRDFRGNVLWRRSTQDIKGTQWAIVEVLDSSRFFILPLNTFDHIVDIAAKGHRATVVIDVLLGHITIQLLVQLLLLSLSSFQFFSHTLANKLFHVFSRAGSLSRCRRCLLF